MFKPDKQSIQLFSKYCKHCPDFMHCFNTRHLNQEHNCEHWDIFIEILTSVDKYVNEYIYNELVKIQEENQRRI